MKRFQEEVLEQYPDWFAEDNDIKDFPVIRRKIIKKINVERPMYVFPMILTMLLLGVYCCVLYRHSEVVKIETQQALAHMEKRLICQDKQIKRNKSDLNLIAILHNENFASVRQITGNQNLIFINPDWTIDDMPDNLKLTDEQKKEIAENYLKQDGTK